MDQNQAVAVLQEKVYLPAFLTKMAELGMPVNTEEGLQKALAMAAHVRMSKSAASQSRLDVVGDVFLKAAGIPTQAAASQVTGLMADADIRAALTQLP